MRKVIIGSLAFLSFNVSTQANSLYELLSAVQGYLTEWESQGIALQKPYEYTKMVSYYYYGELFSSYAFDKAASDMLNLAICTAYPVDCRPYLWFLLNLNSITYEKLKKEQPILLAKAEASYDAYFEWNLIQTQQSSVLSFDYLKAMVKKDFYTYWKKFIQSAPKPLGFVVRPDEKKLYLNDVFLLQKLNYAAAMNWFKKAEVYYCSNSFYSFWKSNFPYLAEKTEIHELPQKIINGKCTLDYIYIWIY